MSLFFGLIFDPSSLRVIGTTMYLPICLEYLARDDLNSASLMEYDCRPFTMTSM
jgi:hypothetical protein